MDTKHVILWEMRRNNLSEVMFKVDNSFSNRLRGFRSLASKGRFLDGLN